MNLRRLQRDIAYSFMVVLWKKTLKNFGKKFQLEIKKKIEKIAY